MEVRRLPTDDDALRRDAAELWLPCRRELAAAVGAHAPPHSHRLVAISTYK